MAGWLDGSLTASNLRADAVLITNTKWLDALRGSSPARVLRWYTNSRGWYAMQKNSHKKLGRGRGPIPGQSVWWPWIQPMRANRVQLGPNLPSLGSPRTSGAPKRVLSWPKQTLFACFLELGGSIWAITVLNEPGIPLRRSGHPTSLYLKQKEFPEKLGRGN